MNKLICTAALVVGLGMANGAAAERPCGQQAPCPPITLEGPVTNPWPADDPAANAFLPGGDAPPGYVAEEFFFSGTANVFNYNEAEAEMGAAPGDNLVVRDADVPYKTRLVMYRPANADRFNGTVVIEFFNSTGGFDYPQVWLDSNTWFRQQGIVHIGVTTSGTQALPFLVNGCGGGFRPPCGSRYETLSIPDNGQEYEIVSQLASALKRGQAGETPMPAGFRPVQRVFVTAYSQQAASVLTMASQFHQDAIDGYFPQANGRARPISGNVNLREPLTEDFCSHPDAAPWPDCIGALAPGQPQVRTNLPVPVYQGMSETDIVLIGGIANRQADTDTSPYGSYRLVEIPGTAHASQGGDDILGYGLGDLCVYPAYFHDAPISAIDVFNAYWAAMHLQVDRGILPPYAPRIASDANGTILRDADGNALGGVRLPEFEFPKASYFSPTNTIKSFCEAGQDPEDDDCLPLPPALQPLLGLACRLIGSQEPFTAQELAARYPVRGRYAHDFSMHTLELAKQRLLLPEDARRRLIAVARGEI